MSHISDIVYFDCAHKISLFLFYCIFVFLQISMRHANKPVAQCSLELVEFDSMHIFLVLNPFHLQFNGYFDMPSIRN